MLHELPLVTFTIIAQMCVGAFVTLGVIHVLGAAVPRRVMDRVSDPALYALGPLLVLGLAASTFHLGSPLRAAMSPKPSTCRVMVSGLVCVIADSMAR